MDNLHLNKLFLLVLTPKYPNLYNCQKEQDLFSAKNDKTREFDATSFHLKNHCLQLILEYLLVDHPIHLFGLRLKGWMEKVLKFAHLTLKAFQIEIFSRFEYGLVMKH